MKILDYDLTQLPQDPIDAIEDIRTLLNFGKYQFATVSSAPTWLGRRGECAIYISGSTGRFYICTSDNSSANWVIGFTFTP